MSRLSPICSTNDALPRTSPVIVFRMLYSTQPPPLEDYTGIHCVNCPDGHVIMASIAAANPGLVSLVGIHAGGFAVPSGTEPDFRTPEGNALNSFYGVSGYPSGVINRHAFTGGTVRNRGYWVSDVAEILALPSPVN